jgi:hypothetical protein
MKKRISLLVIALIMSMSLFSLTVFASQDAALAFDNDSSIELFVNDNAELVKTTGFKYAVSNKETFDGEGALAVSESYVGNPIENSSGGAYITADSLGLTDFAGCTISAKLYPTATAMAVNPEIVLYTDGMLYLPTATTDFTADSWNDVTLVVPENCNNTRFGFLVPVKNTFSGDVFYLDEVVITRPDGSLVSNVGDYAAPEEGLSGDIDDTLAIILGAILVVGVIAIVILLIYLIVRRTKRYH